MKTLNKSEIAVNSKGILIYAFNTNFDYVKSAEFAAIQAKKFLKLPVTLVTDTPVTNDCFDTVVVIDKTETSDRVYRSHNGEILNIEWLNKNRTSAYNLSPYDKTLLIDADFFMFNDSLRPMFETDTEFACYDKINDVTGKEQSLIRIGQTSIPMQWATVVYFKKSNIAQSIFDFMDYIKKNWTYYSALYRFRSSSYRNDFSLSVAVQALSGYTTNIVTLPGTLATMFSNVDVLKVTGSEIVFRGDDNCANKIVGTNIHCMNKLVLDKFYDTK